MSQELIIDGNKFLPTTIACKDFGYTKDYLILLIKAKKIIGKKIGNKWFVSIPSATAFFEDAKKSKIERSEKIRRERKEELRAHAVVVVESKNIASTETLLNPVALSDYAFTTSHRAAVIETLVITVLGLSLGVMGYVGSSHPQQGAVAIESHFFERLAVSVYGLFTTNKKNIYTAGNEVSESAQEVLPAAVTRVATINPSEDVSSPSLIVAPVTDFPATSTDSIAESFSDIVEVSPDPEHENTGIITPIFKDHVGEEYRYLMVPVRESNKGSE